MAIAKVINVRDECERFLKKVTIEDLDPILKHLSEIELKDRGAAVEDFVRFFSHLRRTDIDSRFNLICRK